MKKIESQLRTDIRNLNSRLHLSSSFCEIVNLKKELKIKIKELIAYENQSKSNQGR